MKHLKRLLAVIAIIAIMACSFTSVYAKNDYALYQNSIVMVIAQVEFSGSNSGINFSLTGSGTGFAVGVPGEPVQYIATCNHVVNKPEGIYAVIMDINTNEIIHYERMEDGTETGEFTEEIDGVEYAICVDYFKTKPTQIIALYSGSTNDQVSLTVAQTNEDADVAVCKISSEPTSKLSAMPLQLNDTVAPNTGIVAVGFPGMSTEINAELRLDGSDSTIKDGRIGKKQRTASMFDEKVMIDTYQLTAATAQGMSGGPVISEETNSVVGLVAFSYIDSSQLKTDDYAICVDYLKTLLDAEGIDYVIGGTSGINIWLIVAIAAAVVVIAIVVILVVLLGKKSNKSEPAFVQNENVFNGNNFNATESVSADKKYLIGVSGYMAGKKFNVTSRAVIGRDKNKCNVVYPIDQPGVSGVHCELKFENGVFILKDCGSSYGTFLIDGRQLEPNVPVVLTNGAQFWIGSKDNLFTVKY